MYTWCSGDEMKHPAQCLAHRRCPSLTLQKQEHKVLRLKVHRIRKQFAAGCCGEKSPMEVEEAAALRRWGAQEGG